jgi:hypothetical protein
MYCEKKANKTPVRIIQYQICKGSDVRSKHCRKECHISYRMNLGGAGAYMINAPHIRYRDHERQVHDNTEGHVGDACDKHLAVGSLLVAVVPLVGTGDIFLGLFGQLKDTVVLVNGTLLGPGL